VGEDGPEDALGLGALAGEEGARELGKGEEGGDRDLGVVAGGPRAEPRLEVRTSLTSAATARASGSVEAAARRAEAAQWRTYAAISFCSSLSSFNAGDFSTMSKMNGMTLGVTG
jgi:hypothetical protein